MPLDITGGDLIGNALVAQRRHQPIEQGRRVPAADGRGNLLRPTGVVENCGRADDAADFQDQPRGMVERLVPCR